MQRTLFIQAGIGNQVDRDLWYQTTGKRIVKKTSCSPKPKSRESKVQRSRQES